MLTYHQLRNRMYVSAGLFLAAMLIGVFYEVWYVALLPMVLVILWAAFVKLEYIIFLITLSTPLSINLEELELGGIGMYLPTEPLLAGVLVLFVFKLFSGRSIDGSIFKHPIAVVIYAMFAWMLLTTITSELPLVSVKFMVARAWFVISFFFVLTHILVQNLSRTRTFFLLYLFPLFGVIIYTVVRHSFYGFDKDSSHWVMEPLFKDHTSYGAVLAMYFPVMCGLLVSRKNSPLLRVLLWIGFVILTTGLVLSYTRAAWISVIGAAGILGILLLRIRLRTLVLSMTVIGTFLFLSWDDIQVSLERNKQESSDKLEEHVGSISNVSSDASNLERLNRWNCAWEMFIQRPVFGWGPGTYQFVYAPFQRSKDRTIISTNRGDGGNAHSEYLGPLSEQGVPGMLLVLVLLLAVSSLAFRLFYTSEDYEEKVLIASVYLGLMTYFIHGVLNNYLDTDKASIPFWGFIAVLVALDIRRNQTTIRTGDT